MEDKREFLVEAHGNIAERAYGTRVTLRGPEASGALLLPLRPADVPGGTWLRVSVERRQDKSAREQR